MAQCGNFTFESCQCLDLDAQWQAAARQREDKTGAILNSCYKDKFHKLTRYQRKACKRHVTVDFGVHTRDTEANLWGSYFKQLATSQQDDTYDSEYEKYLQINYLPQSLTLGGDPLPPVGSTTIGKLIHLIPWNHKTPPISLEWLLRVSAKTQDQKPD